MRLTNQQTCVMCRYWSTGKGLGVGPRIKSDMWCGEWARDDGEYAMIKSPKRTTGRCLRQPPVRRALWLWLLLAAWVVGLEVWFHV